VLWKRRWRIIRHDRWFLDRIATHRLAFDGDKHVERFEGNSIMKKTRCKDSGWILLSRIA
jgi:hypothetical protein